MAKISTPNFSTLAAHWPSPYIARGEVERFTGGIVTKRYLANLDSQGKGPCGRVKVGRKVAYPVADFIRWLEARAEVIKK